MFSIQVGRVFIQRIAVSHPSWVKRREVEHVCTSGRRKRACTRVSSSALADGARKKNSLSLETDLSDIVGAREKSVCGSCKGEESGESKIVGFGGEIRKLLDLKGKVGKKETEGYVEVVIVVVVVVVVVEGFLCCKSRRYGKEVAFSSLLQ